MTNRKSTLPTASRLELITVSKPSLIKDRRHSVVKKIIAKCCHDGVEEFCTAYACSGYVYIHSMYLPLWGSAQQYIDRALLLFCLSHYIIFTLHCIRLFCLQCKG